MDSNTSVGETILVAETGLGRYQVEARVGNAAFLIDEPVASGGLGSGPQSLQSAQRRIGRLQDHDHPALCQPQRLAAPAGAGRRPP